MQTTSRFSVHDPDVAHDIVGLTGVCAVGAAIVAFIALAVGGAAWGIAILAVPALVARLALRACWVRDARLLRSLEARMRE
jgi:hypothetical protein